MGRVFFAMGMSLDGYVEDAGGSFDFAVPDDEVHRIANEQARDAAVFVFGRRMYELMEGYWPSAAAAPEELSEVAAEFARAYVETPRVVVSDSLGDDVPDGVGSCAAPTPPPRWHVSRASTRATSRSAGRRSPQECST